MAGKDPDQFMQQMMRDNSQFNQFVAENVGKSPEEICRKYGKDPNILKLIK